AVLLGVDTGPNPAEALLHALAACLTTSLVYVAAARKVRLTAVESTLEGEMDVRGALGLSDEVRNGFSSIRVSFKVEGDAPAEKLREVVDRAQARSAVFDMVSHGVPVEGAVATSEGGSPQRGGGGGRGPPPPPPPAPRSENPDVRAHRQDRERGAPGAPRRDA